MIKALLLASLLSASGQQVGKRPPYPTPPANSTTPTFSPAAGSYTTPQNVAIQATPGAFIFYEVNGTPQLGVSPYCLTVPCVVRVSGTEQLCAVAYSTILSHSNVGCASYTIGAPVFPQPPTVLAFTATPSTIVPGASALLQCAVNNATSISIDQDVGAITGLCNRTVSPRVTTEYTLSVSNSAGTTPAKVTVTVSSADLTVPIITAATIPSLSSTLLVPITAFTATDNVAVTGYAASESPSTPALSAFTSSAPTQYAFAGEGSRTLYFWARDAAGNVSARSQATCIITLPGPPPVLADCTTAPLRSTGTIYYYCDCQAGSASGCVAGNDSNAGTSPSAPQQSLSALGTRLNSMQAGDTVAMCRGGRWAGVVSASWQNSNCTSASTCDLRDYVPSWGSSGSPKPYINGGSSAGNGIIHAFGNGPYYGYRIWNIAFRHSGFSYDGSRSIFILGGHYNTDICGIDSAMGALGIVAEAGGGITPDGIKIRASTFTAHGMDAAYLEATNLTIDSNRFIDCGDQTIDASRSSLMHTIYVAGGSASARDTGLRVTNNYFITHADNTPGATPTGELYTYGQCRGVQLILRGYYDGSIVENNDVIQYAGYPCGGIVMNHNAGPSDEINAHFRRNRVSWLGTTTTNPSPPLLAVSSCSSGCTVESNIVEAAASTGTGAIQVPEETHAANGLAAVTSGVVIRGNSVRMAAGGTGFVVGKGGEGSDFVVENNVVWGTSGSTCYNVSQPLLTGHPYTKTDYPSTSTNTAGNYCVSNGAAPSVIWANAPGGDYTPAGGGPLVGTGNQTYYDATSIGSVAWSPTDQGVPRSPPIDIGAVQASAPAAPSAVTYSANPVTYTVNVAIASNTPTIIGGVPTSYSVSPALPSGLSLNTATGYITGAPSQAKNVATYTVTATNAAGSASVGVQITVSAAVQAPANLAYSVNPATYTTGTAIAPNSPSSSGGAVVSYGINPSLPAGLSFDTTTGIISGTPSATATIATYTVTATNTGGSTSVGVQITVNAPAGSNTNLVASADAIAVGIRTTGADPKYVSLSLGTCTVTGNYAAGPSGAYSGQATRFLCPAGQSPTFEFRHLDTLTPGSAYAASFWVRTNAADTHIPADVGYQVIDSSNGATVLATTLYPAGSYSTDTRICFSFTAPTSGGVGIRYLLTGGQYAHDLLAWGLKVEAGTSCTGTAASLAPGQP
jgi:hypothetical protein